MWQWSSPDVGTQQFFQKADEPFDLQASDNYDVELSDLEKEFYPFSPDQTKYLWMTSYTYGSLVRKDGKVVLDPSTFLGGEPDTDVKLIDLVNKKSKTLLTCGPSCGYDYVFWLDNDNFVVLAEGLAMHEVIGMDAFYTRVPTIYLYSLSNKNVRIFEGREVEEQYFFKQLEQ